MVKEKRNRRVKSEAPVKKTKKTKNKARFSLFNFILSATFIALIGFFIFNISKSIWNSVDLYYKNKALEARIEDLYYEKEKLVEEQENLLTDAEIEQLAKEKLGLIKPGEVVYVLENIN